MPLLHFPAPQPATHELPRAAPPNQNIELSFPPLDCVTAVKEVGRLRGSTEPRLVRANDGALYVTKLSSNPFGTRVLTNEYLSHRLARGVGLATPNAAIVSTSTALDLPPGPHFGSRLHKSRGNVYVHEWVPAGAWGLVENRRDVVGAYVFDLWTGNVDTRQFLFARRSRTAELRVYLIDNSHCFGGHNWGLTDVPNECPRQLRFAYADVANWSDFDPWLSTIERLESSQVQRAAEGVPKEWLSDADSSAFNRLLAQLDVRRFGLRALIASLLGRGNHPFTGWRFRSSLFVMPPVKSFGKTA